MSISREALKFHEADRINIQVTQADFSHEETFEYLEESEELVDYLLSKKWDKYFKTLKSGIVICDTTIVNKIYGECSVHFGKKLDSVQLFHIITDFYNIEGSRFFNKLVQSYRNILVKDLERRIGVMNSLNVQKVGKDRLQLAFKLILNK